MFSMSLGSSVKISDEFISHDVCPDTLSNHSQGFTLLELIVSMTIISMVVLVLYFAFSTGVRSWDSDVVHGEQEMRLEAVLRLMEDDLGHAVPYNMNWQKGPVSLFAGGPRTMFYVTGNGTGAFSGAGAGLFFSILYVDDCPDETLDCLFVYKSFRPSPEYISSADQFRTASEFQRENFSPDTEIAEKSLLVLKGLEGMNFSYSSERFAAFAGTNSDGASQLMDDNQLDEEFWVSDELPGQVRIDFSFDDRDFFVLVPVGE